MTPPIYVRQLSLDERQALEKGLHSSDAFVLRRSQILLASARREHSTPIALAVGCSDQTVRNVIHGFNETGLEVLKKGSSAPLTRQPEFDASGLERMKELLHHSPRQFGKPTGRWTLELVAEVSFDQGLTQRRVSIETIRRALLRLGVNWKRAKHWITSPDPGYARKKSSATGSSAS